MHGEANPSGRVTTACFEYVCGVITAAIADQSARHGRPVDGVLLALHGAMATETLDDAEAEVLRRVHRALAAAAGACAFTEGPRNTSEHRDVCGDADCRSSIPVVVTLDLHANLTAAMASYATGVISYRTYPHVDMKATGIRAARILSRAMASRDRAGPVSDNSGKSVLAEDATEGVAAGVAEGAALGAAFGASMAVADPAFGVAEKQKKRPAVRCVLGPELPMVAQCDLGRCDEPW